MSSLQDAVSVNIDSLAPNPLQPRGQILLETINELIESIKEHGVLEPLLLAETPAGLQIIAGERRWRAAKAVGLKTVPAIIKKTTPQGMLEMAIVENVHRTNLNPVERAHAYKRLIEEFSLSISEVARRVGKTQGAISNAVRILELPDAVKDGLISGALTEGHAKAIVSLEDPETIISVFKEILKKELSVRAVEEMARNIRNRKQASKNKANAKSNVIPQEKVEIIRKTFEEKFEGRCQISTSNRRIKLTLVFKGKPESINARFSKFISRFQGDS